MTRNSCSTSLGSSDEVGSSRITTFASVDTALTIAIICCTATPTEPSGRRSSTAMPYRRRRRAASAFIFLTSTNPNPRMGSRPRSRFWAMVMNGSRLISWNVVLMPASQASRGRKRQRAHPLVGARPRQRHTRR